MSKSMSGLWSSNMVTMSVREGLLCPAFCVLSVSMVISVVGGSVSAGGWLCRIPLGYVTEGGHRGVGCCCNDPLLCMSLGVRKVSPGLRWGCPVGWCRAESPVPGSWAGSNQVGIPLGAVCKFGSGN